LPDYVGGVGVKGLYKTGQLETLAEHGFFVRQNIRPIYDPATHSLVGDGVTVTDTGTAFAYLIVPLTADQLGEAKRKAIESVKQFGVDARKLVARNAEPIEVAGWLDRKIVAKEYLADPDNAPAELIAPLEIEVATRGRGETPLILAQRQMLLAGYYSQAIAEIDGFVESTLDLIDAATDGATDLIALNEVVADSSDPSLSRLAELAAARP
jgi:hypothetical protein